MKKVFTVELEVNETEKGKDVIYDGSLENMLEQWLDGFIDTNCIDVDYSLNVTEKKENSIDFQWDRIEAELI